MTVIDTSVGDALGAEALPTGWSLEPMTGTLGAVIHGVDLTTDLADDEVAAIRSALLGFRVVFFRGQHVSPTQQVAFARRFGRLTAAHPLLGGLDEDHPEVLVLDSADYPLGVGTRSNGTSYNNRWHTDVTFSATPPMASVLAAKVIPRRGGDTLWADLVDAYESLSAPIRTLLDPMVAVDDAQGTFDRFRYEDPSGDQRAKLAHLQPVRHPVVRVHPETGERGLFVNETFTAGIEGLSPAESDGLLQILYRHSVEPERVVRWKWSEGDVVVWDNRATAHYAAADYGAERRIMHRITVAGERPVGIGGSIDPS